MDEIQRYSTGRVVNPQAGAAITVLKQRGRANLGPGRHKKAPAVGGCGEGQTLRLVCPSCLMILGQVAIFDHVGFGALLVAGGGTLQVGKVPVVVGFGVVGVN